MCDIQRPGDYCIEEVLAKKGYFESASRVAESVEKDLAAMDLSQLGQAHGRSVFIILRLQYNAAVYTLWKVISGN